MIFWIKKRFIVALILCLGVMQLLLPFLHAHHDGDVLHVKNKASLLHIHEIQRNDLAMHQSFDGISDIHTELVERGFEAAVVGVDHAVPSQKYMDTLDLVAILVVIICLIALSGFINHAYFANVKQAYSNRRPLSRAPPNAYK